VVAARGRGLRPGGIVRSAGRLVLLIGLGFGAGLVIGVLSEEPTLLAGHLRGESASVRLGGRGGSGSANGPASVASGAGQTEAHDGPPTDRRRHEDAARDSTARADPGSPEDDAKELQQGRLALLEGREAGATEEWPPPEVAAPPRDPPTSQPAGLRKRAAAVPGAGRWSIQVGAFSDSGSASGLAKTLRSKGYPVELIPATEESERWRVRVQPVEGQSRAKELAERLKREERLPTWLIPLEADAGS